MLWGALDPHPDHEPRPESVFATVRLRHDKTIGSRTRTACLMVFKLMESASKGSQSLNGSRLLAWIPMRPFHPNKQPVYNYV
jgi:hypothetical protein